MRSKKFQEFEDSGIRGDALREKIVEAIQAENEKTEIASSEGESGRSDFGSAALEWAKGAAIAVVIAVVLLQFIKPTIVQQRSMEPNFETNDYLFISRQSYKLFGGEPGIGDVIVFNTELKTNEGENKLLIKRVIGVPGDEISIAGGKVYVNGQIIDDSYTMDGTTNGDIDRIIVPVDTVFCLGDNRLVSVDSRDDSVGFISYDDIMGKVVFRLFPIRKFGKIDNPYEYN